MDMNVFVAEELARTHLAELHARAARDNLVRGAAPARAPLRAVVGRLLVRMGHRLLGDFATARAAA